MSKPARCEECQAILEEMRRARRESQVSPQRREELRAYVGTLRQMQAGTVERVDELLVKFPFRAQALGPVRPPEAWYSEADNPGMLRAVRKMFKHQARTGHKFTDLLFRK